MRIIFVIVLFEYLRYIGNEGTINYWLLNNIGISFNLIFFIIILLTFVTFYLYDSHRYKMKESDQAFYVLPFTGVFLYLLIVDYPIKARNQFCFKKDNDRYVYLDKEVHLYKEKYFLNKIFSSGLLSFEKIKKVECTTKEIENRNLFNNSRNEFFLKNKSYWKTQEGIDLKEKIEN